MSALDQFRLDNKVAIVTGASSGLGINSAEALAQAGADLALGRGAPTDLPRRRPG